MSLPKHIEEAIHHYINHMEGWTTSKRACEMAERILEIKAQVCVDIGVFAARSTIAMGFAARELGNSIVYGIDPWHVGAAPESDDNKEGVDWWKEKANLEEMHRQSMKAVWDHNLEPWVVIIRARSEYCSQLFTSIDVLNIDGNHSKVASCRDAMTYIPKVRSGGIVLMDDTSWPSTQDAIKIIEQHCDLLNVMEGEVGGTESRTYKKR